MNRQYQGLIAVAIGLVGIGLGVRRVARLGNIELASTPTDLSWVSWD